MKHHFFWPSFTFQEGVPNPWLADNLLPVTSVTLPEETFTMTENILALSLAKPARQNAEAIL